MLSFSFTLLLFVITLALVFLVVLEFSRKSRNPKRELKSKIAKGALISAYVSLLLLIVFQHLWNTSLPYFLLFSVTVILLLFAIIGPSSSNKKYSLILVILLHVVALSMLFPRIGIMITERSPAFLKLREAKSWNTEWLLLDSYYNPFPVDLGLFYTFETMTNINYIDLFSKWIIFLFFLIAYDLTLFSLARKIGGSWMIGILAIVLFTFTPPLIIDPQPQWLANLFVFLCTLELFKALKYSPSASNAILINLSYSIAILLHGTAAIFLVIATILFALMLFGRKIRMNITTTSFNRSFIYVILISIYLITLCRWIILGGFEPVVTPISALFDDLLGIGQTTWIGTQYTSLYDQFVSPILAYAWALPLSLAFAFLLFHFINRAKRKSLEVVFALSMGLAGSSLAFVGFLGSLLISHANLQRYLGYASIPILIPVAAMAFAKILRYSSWKIVSMGLISILLFTEFGICDPGLSPQLYTTIKTVNPILLENLVEGNTLRGIISEKTNVISTYEILTALWYLNLLEESSEKTIKFYASSLKTHRIMAEELMEEKEALPGVIYIWTPEILAPIEEIPVNVIYNSGQHVAVEGIE